MKHRDSAAHFLGVALLVLPPLLYLPWLHEPFRLPKQVASEVLGLALLAAISWARRHAGAGAPTRRSSGALAVVPLAAVVAMSAALSSHPEQSLRSGLGFAVAVATVCGLASWRPNVRPLLDWLVLPASALSIVMLLQHFAAGSRAGLDADGPARLALGSLAGNVGDLTSYLVLPSLLAQSGLRHALRGGQRLRAWSWALALGLFLTTLLVAQTLVPIAALATGTVVLWAAGPFPPRRRALTLLTVTALAVGVTLWSPLHSRLSAEWRELRAGSLQDVLSGRLDGWRAGLHIGSENPVLGAGPGAYRAEFAEAKLALAERGVRFYQGHGKATHFDQAHNETIEVFADLGVAGLLAGAWLLWFLCAGALALPGADERALALSVLAAFLVLAQFWFPLRSALVGWPYVVAAAWLLSASRWSRPVSRGPSSERPAGAAKTGPAPRARRSGAIILALLLGGATILSAYAGVGRLRANRALRMAEDEANGMARRGTLDRVALRRNVKMLERARLDAPHDERIPLAIGSHYLLLGDLSVAEAWYRKSLDIAPRAETFLNLGRVRRLRGDAAEAKLLTYQAVVLSPTLAQELPAP